MEISAANTISSDGQFRQAAAGHRNSVRSATSGSGIDGSSVAREEAKNETVASRVCSVGEASSVSIRNGGWANRESEFRRRVNQNDIFGEETESVNWVK